MSYLLSVAIIQEVCEYPPVALRGLQWHRERRFSGTKKYGILGKFYITIRRGGTRLLYENKPPGGAGRSGGGRGNVGVMYPRRTKLIVLSLPDIVTHF